MMRCAFYVRGFGVCFFLLFLIFLVFVYAHFWLKSCQVCFVLSSQKKA